MQIGISPATKGMFGKSIHITNLICKKRYSIFYLLDSKKIHLLGNIIWLIIFQSIFSDTFEP